MSKSFERAAMPNDRHEKGRLPDGTPYVISVPANWNGVLIRDLDAVNRSEAAGLAPMYQDMLARGYAFAGTMRHRLRMFQYDPVREIANLDRVLDMVEARFGHPSRVIQYGCSGGGHLTIAVCEDFFARIHGGVALAAHTPVWLMNTFLDGWFALKTLLSPYYEAAGGNPAELAIVGLENDGTANPTAHGRTGALPDAWRRAVQEAQRSPAGRARMVLAFCIGQWPAWVNENTPKPDLADAHALQASMHSALLQNAANPGGEARIMFENAANGEQLSWNDSIDFKTLYEAANPSLRAAAEQLYTDAGLNIADDLSLLNDEPRITASPHALEFWSAKGRTTRGVPKIPLLRLHMIGDYQIPPSLVEGYEAEVGKNNQSDNFRSAYLEATGHCNFTAAESTAAIQSVLARIETGQWPDVGAAALNERAGALDTGTPSRFTDYTPYRHPIYSRTWLPGTAGATA